MSDKVDKLSEARKKINEIDAEMARLFMARMEAVGVVAKYKKEHGLPILDRAREAAVIERGAAMIDDEALRSYYISYLKYNMALSRKYQHRLLEGMRIAFSGVSGAFADIAASRIFPSGVRVPCPDFKSAYDAVASGDCDCAVLPIENSTNGDVTQVMDLAYSGELCVSGVYELAVEHCLLCLPGASIKDIKTVVSHPQALGQCAPYIRRHGWSQREAVNTATAAMEVARNGDVGIGVIASYETAELYGLRVLERKINEHNNNITRFAVFTRNILPPLESDDRFIMFFTVKNTAGALLRAIEAIGQAGFNLRALKSRPTKETNWDYYFFAEGEGSLATSEGRRMLASLSEVCGSIKILGSFDREKLLHEPENADSEIECALSAIED